MVRESEALGLRSQAVASRQREHGRPNYFDAGSA